MYWSTVLAYYRLITRFWWTQKVWGMSWSSAINAINCGDVHCHTPKLLIHCELDPLKLSRNTKLCLFCMNSRPWRADTATPRGGRRTPWGRRRPRTGRTRTAPQGPSLWWIGTDERTVGCAHCCDEGERGNSCCHRFSIGLLLPCPFRDPRAEESIWGKLSRLLFRFHCERCASRVQQMHQPVSRIFFCSYSTILDEENLVT